MVKKLVLKLYREELMVLGRLLRLTEITPPSFLTDDEKAELLNVRIEVEETMK